MDIKKTYTMTVKGNLKPGRKTTKVKRTQAKYVKGVPRPFMWLIGSDATEYKHSMYHPWQLSKAQAVFRKEDWDLTFEEYYDLWKDDWNNRGRDPDNMCMTRYDPELGWTKGNVFLITRHEHLKQQGFARRGVNYKPRPAPGGKRGRPRKNPI